MNLKKLAKELNYLKEDTDYMDSSGFGKGITPEEEAIWQQFLKDNPGVTIGDIMKNPKIRSIWRRRASEKGPDVKYISGDLDNATIELEGKVYNNVSFEDADEINTGRMAYDEPIRHEYTAKVDGATFTVETESFGEEGEREVQWDTLEAEYETTDEGTCGFAPDGEVDAHNTDKLTPAGPHLMRKRMGEIIEKIIKQTLKESKYFKTLDEEVNEDMRLAVEESQKKGGDFNSIAEKYNVDRFELEEAVERALEELKNVDRDRDELDGETNEGNAYIDAMRTAKEAGKDEFEFNGETHKIK